MQLQRSFLSAEESVFFVNALTKLPKYDKKKVPVLTKNRTRICPKEKRGQFVTDQLASCVKFW